MTTMAWGLAIGGILLCAGAIAAICYDIEAVRHGGTTISEWCLRAGRANPWVPAVLGVTAGLLLGALIGHLWFPQAK